MKLIVATHNVHKIQEFSRILTPLGVQVDTAELTEAEETGKTFRENAYIKAQSACSETGLPSVADDSGLCIGALDGEPGVYSARYAPPGQRKTTVLGKMNGAKDRSAQFVSAICCVFPNGDIIEAEGICHGAITCEMLGQGGFGYDPIFQVGDKTFGQMTPQEKDAVSHRGKALRDFKNKLEAYLDFTKERG